MTNDISTYTPKPIDTSQVKVPTHLKDLTEVLASSIHDSWARQRISQGWTYGPKRDDDKMTHPDLVPYADLTESEKEYDRNSAMDTLKIILSMSYSITPAQMAVPQKEMDAETLDASQERAKVLRKSGDSLIAFDHLQKCLKKWPDNDRLRQLEALVLADMGATSRANDILTQLVNRGCKDEESLSLLGRTHKDLGLKSATPQERELHLRTSLQLYASAFDLTGGYYSGINAATLAVLAGELDRGRRLAASIRDICQQSLADPEKEGDRYYLTATLAEALLILEERAEAERMYVETATLGQGQWKNIQSTRRNARLLYQALDMDGAWVENALQVPAVAVFVGHAADRPDTKLSRLSAHDAPLMQAVAASIVDFLDKRNIGFGFASAEPGADIIFLEILLEQGKEAHMILPYKKELFLARHLAADDDGQWSRRFESLYETLESQGRVTLASDWPLGTEQSFCADSYEFTSRYLYGLARLKATQLETEVFPLALWNGAAGDGMAGTAATVAWWTDMGLPVEIIDLECLAGRRENPVTTCPPEALRLPRKKREGEQGEFKAEVRALLFADVVGYSALEEKFIPPFVKTFLGAVAEMLAKKQYAPLVKNTWGDAIYSVFADVRSAGLFALDLVAIVNAKQWDSKDLPEDLSLRVSLHAGPVYACLDPIQDAFTYTGTHVSRAARIEPITPKGTVWASEAFAALAAADGVTEFSCAYVGKAPLAKNYGTFPLYQITRAIGEGG